MHMTPEALGWDPNPLGSRGLRGPMEVQAQLLQVAGRRVRGPGRGLRQVLLRCRGHPGEVPDRAV